MSDDAAEGGFGGSPEEFDRLYDEYFPRVYRFLSRRLGEPEATEHATREVFVELVRTLDELTEAELAERILRIARRQLRRP